MNRLLGGVIRISNTVDCAFQTYFHLNFQFGTLWRSSRRENRFDDIRCEVACAHCAFICFNWSSVGRGSKIAVTRSFNHQEKQSPVFLLGNPSSSTIMVWEKLGDGRVRRHFYPVLFDCSLGFGSWTCGFNDGCLQVKRGGLRAEQAATAQARAARRRPEMFHLSRHSKATHQ